MRFHVLPLLALAGVTFAQASDEDEVPQEYIDAAMTAYATLPVVSAVVSVYSKYHTLSGFDSVESELGKEIATYAMTQTHLTEQPTATDIGALMTDPAVMSVVDGVVSEITEYLETQTYMSKGVGPSMAADITSVIGKADATPTAGKKGSNSPSGTGNIVVQSQDAGASGVRAGIVGVVVAVAAVALVV